MSQFNKGGGGGNHIHVGFWKPDSNIHTHIHNTVGLLNSTRESDNPAPGLMEKGEMGKMEVGGGVNPPSS